MQRTISVCVALAVFLALCVSVYADEPDDHDGYWWNRNDRMFKLGYIIGLCDGVAGVLNSLRRESLILDSYAAKPEEEKEEFWMFWGYYPLDWQNTADILRTIGKREWTDWAISSGTYGQLVDGLDEFYSDYRNKTLAISDALPIVGMELRGLPPEMIDDQKRLLRIRKTMREKVTDGEAER